MAQKPIQIKPHLTYEEVEKKYKTCKNYRIKNRWRLIKLLIDPKKPILVAKAADKVGLCQRWSRMLVHRYNKEGEAGLEEKRKNNGNKPLLNEKQQAKLKRLLIKGKPADGGLWTGPKVVNWIKKETNIKITPVGAWKYLKKLKLSIQTPRPSHIKSATIEEKALFKKNSK